MTLSHHLSAADHPAPKARHQKRGILPDAPFLANHANIDTNAPHLQDGVHFDLDRGAFSVSGVQLDKREFVPFTAKTAIITHQSLTVLFVR